MIQAQIKAPWHGWEIAEHLGGGSFGSVYKIQRHISGETEYAAMKVISVPSEAEEGRDLLSSGYDLKTINLRYQKDLDRIKAEYIMMAMLKGNANVVYCDDIYDEPNPDGIGWKLYIRMELLTPLKKALTNNITDAQVVKLGMDLCNALAACKRKNIIHRDIKPANIMVAEDGHYKLGDFGVAKTLETVGGGTKTGTYSFMAPEVYLSRPYGHSADLYSLGMVLYWMLNHRCGPFLPLPPNLPSASEAEQAQQRRFSGEELPAPAQGSDALKAVVLKACAFQPEDRYESPEMMYAALEAVRRDMIRHSEFDEGVAPVVHKPEPAVHHEATTAKFDQNNWGTMRGDETIGSIRTTGNFHTVGDQTVGGGQTIATSNTPKTETTPLKTKKRSKALALILAIFPYTGMFGIHDFYLGKYGMGVLKLFTSNFFIIGWVIDIIRLLTGKYKLPEGTYLE